MDRVSQPASGRTAETRGGRRLHEDQAPKLRRLVVLRHEGRPRHFFKKVVDEAAARRWRESGPDRHLRRDEAPILELVARKIECAGLLLPNGSPIWITIRIGIGKISGSADNIRVSAPGPPVAGVRAGRTGCGVREGVMPALRHSAAQIDSQCRSGAEISVRRYPSSAWCHCSWRWAI